MILNLKQLILAVLLKTYEEEISMAFTEDLLLPSMGIVYQRKDFDGTVHIKPFTTKAYKDLLTGNASETALTQFVDTCLVDCPIKAKNMNYQDVLACLFKIRAMTLGNILTTQVRCPECKTVEDVNWDLNDTEISYLQVDEYPIPVTLPSGQNIKVRFPTGADTTKAKQAAEKRASTFKKHTEDFVGLFTIVSLLDVDNMDLIEKADWYEGISPRDAVYINEVFSEMSHIFEVKMNREAKCSVCDKMFTTYIDIWTDFFRPDSGISLGVRSKIGNLAGPVKKPDISE